MLLFCQEIRPVMIYDSKNIQDKGWNESIHDGIVRFEKKTNIKVKEDFALNKKQFSSKVTKYAQGSYSPIMFINLYKEQKEVLKEILLKFPKIRFVVLNGKINLPNVQSFLFSYQESSFLVGYLASKKSKTKKIGFVGGMNIPIIKNCLCAYIKGAKYENPSTKIIYDYMGINTSLAWNSPNKAYNIALKQIENGVDVIYPPAGGSALGVLKAVNEKNIFGIGIDKNQNPLYPKNILASALVKINNAVYAAFMLAKRDIWGDKTKLMGLQEKGVGLVYNKALISNKLIENLKYITGDILLNKIKIPDYSLSKQCIVDKEVIF